MMIKANAKKTAGKKALRTIDEKQLAGVQGGGSWDLGYYTKPVIGRSEY